MESTENLESSQVNNSADRLRPAPIQYSDAEEYAKQAAYEDAKSGALDEYLFNGDGVAEGVDYFTPFERSLPSKFKFEKQRALQVGNIELAMIREEIARIESETLSLQRENESLEAQKVEKQGAIASKIQEYKVKVNQKISQESKLDPKIEYVLPPHLDEEFDLTSDPDGGDQQTLILKKLIGKNRRASVRGFLAALQYLRFQKYAFLVLIISVVDAVVVWVSLSTTLGSGIEGLGLMAPALGVQIMFPHYVGKFWRQHRGLKTSTTSGGASGDEAKSKLFITLGISFAAVWVAYAGILTTIRRNTFAETLDPNDSASLPKLLIVTALMFVILFGLGCAIIMLDLFDKPEVRQLKITELTNLRKSRKLQRSLESSILDWRLIAFEELFSLNEKLTGISERISFAESKIEMNHKIVEAKAISLVELQKSIILHAETIEQDFPKHAQRSYRRWLANYMADPDFTSKSTKSGI